MHIDNRTVDIPAGLLEAIRSFPLEREFEHCGTKFSVSPFAFYATCAECGARFKIRSFSACGELEDVFDAVFEWMLNPRAQQIARERMGAIAEDLDN